jgi:transposase
MTRKPYPSDVSDAEWALVVPCMTLMNEETPQREYSLREVFNGLRWMVRSGATCRMMPIDLPPWNVIYQQMHRWIKAQVFESFASDLRAVLRIVDGRNEQPTAVIRNVSTTLRHDICKPSVIRRDF